MPALSPGDVLWATGANDAAWGRFQLRHTGSGAPAAADCDEPGEAGALYLDTGSSPRVLYICVEAGAGEGWDSVGLVD